MTAGGRTREYRMMVAEPEPGRVLTDSDMNSSAVTTFTVTAQGARRPSGSPPPGMGQAVAGGLVERMFAPRVLRTIYSDELNRLDTYAREHRSA